MNSYSFDALNRSSRSKKEEEMLSVKYVSDDGLELVLSCTHVLFYPANCYDKDIKQDARHVDCATDQGYTDSFYNGNVYVMNEAGKTVSMYINIGNDKFSKG
jgi:hypothetical protein